MRKTQSSHIAKIEYVTIVFHFIYRNILKIIVQDEDISRIEKSLKKGTRKYNLLSFMSLY